MINKVKHIAILSLLLLVSFSCREELIIDQTGPENQGFTNTSSVADLMQRTSLNDGSNDNIIDGANSFSIQMPYTVTVNGQEVIINTEDDLETVEDIFDEFDDDEDTIQITFPITILLTDFTEVIINNQSELDVYIANSTDEDEIDDDIECIDFVYPISVSIFDSVTEQISNLIINSDNEMYNVLENLDSDDLVSIEFPITLILFDGTEVSISNVSELETAIENAEDSCDEDDDNDYDDDDCDDCTTEALLNILTNCSDWIVDGLERNDEELEDDYIGFTFNFLTNGTLDVFDGSSTINGTWSSSGTGTDIIVVINIPSLPDFNADWHLQEIDQDDTEKTVDLELDDDNNLQFLSTCN